MSSYTSACIISMIKFYIDENTHKMYFMMKMKLIYSTSNTHNTLSSMNSAFSRFECAQQQQKKLKIDI